MKILTLPLMITALSTAADARSNAPLGCFARPYDKAHLAEHPDQTVTAVKLKIYASPPDPKTLWFYIQIRRRGEYKALHNKGVCEQEASVLSCFIECDGGGVRITPRSNVTILMRLGIQPPLGPNGEVIKADERIRMTACGTQDEDDGGGTEVTGGKDDHEFLLYQADDAVCVGIDH